MAPKEKRRQRTIASTGKNTNAGKENHVDHFSHLPIELRQMIYAIAVAQDDPIVPSQTEPRSNKFFGKCVVTRTFTSLLLTCRLFYNEVSDRSDFYRQNTFTFYNPDNLAAFLAALTHRRRSTLRKICIKADNYSWHLRGARRAKVALLSQCNSLELLVLRSRMADPWSYTPHNNPAHVLQQWNLANRLPWGICASNGVWETLKYMPTLRQVQVALDDDFCDTSLAGFAISEDPTDLIFSGNHDFVESDAALVKGILLFNTRLLGFIRKRHLEIENTRANYWEPFTGWTLMASGLDIYGEDRVNQGHQAGAISSRTRGRMSRARETSSNGVIAKTIVNPRYVDIYENDEDDDNERVNEDDRAEGGKAGQCDPGTFGG